MSKEPFQIKVVNLGRTVIPTIESDHQWIHEGRSYTAEYEFSTADAVPLYLHLVPNVTIHLNGVKMLSNINDYLVEMIEDPVMNLNVSPAEVVSRNNNRYRPDNGPMDIYSNSTYVSGGIVLCAHHLYGQDVAGGLRSPVGSSASGPWEWVLNQNKEYAFRISRPGQTGAGKLALELLYYSEE